MLHTSYLLNSFLYKNKCVVAGCKVIRCCRAILLVVLIATLLVVSIAGISVGKQLHASVPPPRSAVCIHFSTVMPMDLAKKLIDYTAELEAKYIRFDIWWYEIEPQLGQFNETALQRYREIIDYMVNKGIQPIAIIGTVYPDRVSSLIDAYENCKNSVSSVSKESCNIVAKSERLIPSVISRALRDAMARSRQHFNPLLELKQIEYVKKVCPAYYYASAKGYLTKDEVLR